MWSAFSMWLGRDSGTSEAVVRKRDTYQHRGGQCGKLQVGQMVGDWQEACEKQGDRKRKRKTAILKRIGNRR